MRAHAVYELQRLSVWKICRRAKLLGSISLQLVFGELRASAWNPKYC